MNHDKLKDELGIVPTGMEDTVMKLLTEPGLYRSMMPPLKPLTRRQKLRYRLAVAHWWLHDHLFPDCHANDDDW